MRKSSWIWTIGLLSVGCATDHRVVYVDLTKVEASDSSISIKAPAIKPPKPLPAKTFLLPAIPERTLENSSSPEVVKSQDHANEAQAAALKTITKRLIKIYQKQIDLFAAQQQALLQDPDAKRLQEIVPELSAAFSRYATARLPLIARLSFLSGVPDTNPKNNPPPATLRPVPRDRWVEANGLRTKVNALDAAYDVEATAILGKASSMAANDRLEILRKVDDYRRQMMDRALEEAMNPLRSRKRPAILRLTSAPQIQLPAQQAQSINIPATPALSPPPQVEFERIGGKDEISKELLQKQLDIWLAINQYSVVRKPSSHIRDATKDFERWRNQQKVGP